MKKLLNIGLLVLVAAASMGASSCGSAGNLISKAPGLYDGLVIRRMPKRSQLVSATARLTTTSDSDLEMHIASSKDPSVFWDFKLHANSGSEATLTCPNLFLGTGTLRKEKDSDYCFSTARGQDGSQLRLCYDGNELSISYVMNSDREYIFALDRHVADAHPKLETPRIYEVSELLELGKNKSFTSELQFQTSVQSRLNSTAAHLNLLPHISLGSVLGVLSFQLNSLPGLIGDLAPFLIPSNWFNANAARWQSNADYYAWLLMKANSGNIAEGLAYLVLRDKAIVQMLATYEPPLDEMREIVHRKEILGLLPRGSTKAFIAILTNLQETEIGLKKLVAAENRDLALAVGLVNPDGVAGVIEDTDLSPDKPVVLDLEEIQNLVIDRSIELRQIDAMINVAHSNVNNRAYSWVSPSGNLSFGLPATVGAAMATVKQLTIQRQQLQATLLQKVENAFDEVNVALHTYALAKQNAVTLKDRFEQYHTGMVTGLAVSVTDLQVALQDEMKGDTDLVTAKYQYYIAMGKLNRMLMSGQYVDIITRVSRNFDDQRP
jgi:hypothetical protein